MNPKTNVRQASAGHGPDSGGMHPDSSRPFGFNIIGYVSANSGVSVSARHLVRLLLDKGYPVAIFDVDPGSGKYKHDCTFDQFAVNSIDELPYSINLISLFIHEMPNFFLQNPSLIRSDRMNAGVIYWELPVLPPIWIKTLELLDVLMATSQSVRSMLECHLSDVLTLYAGCPSYRPSGVHADRARFGLPGEPILFVYSFDPYGEPNRKNPFAVIEAYLRAFPKENNAHLVIKINNSEGNSSLKPLVSREMLLSRCNGDPRVHVISDPLSYAEVMNLYASCDVFVSLHRAEGLGLGLMEAMSLGKPVIATAWSGNMTFMNHTNACLVRYGLVPARGTYLIYNKKFLKREATWAEPDIDHAVAWMRRLAADAQLRESVGRKGAEDIVKFQQESERGKFIQELRAIWTNRQFLPDRTENKRRDLESLRLLIEEEASKRLPGKLRRFLDRHLLWRIAWLNGSAQAQDRPSIS